MKLPEALFRAAKGMNDAWSDIARKLETAYAAWKPTWTGSKSLNEKASVPAPTAAEKRAFWAERHAYARQRVESLPDELGDKILDRLVAVYKRVKQGGGFPKPKKMRHFAVHHRFSAGGLPVERLGGDKAERFRILLPDASLYRNNSRWLRYQRLCPFWFRVDGEALRLNAVIHRQIPAAAIVKEVALVGKKQSPTLAWELYLAITIEIPKAEPNANSRTCGIDVGWRKVAACRCKATCLPGTPHMRVAVLYNGHNHDELVVPLRWRDQRFGEVSLERLANIQQQRDLLLERTKRKLEAVAVPQHPQARNGALIRLLRDTQDAVVKQLLEDWQRDNDRYVRLARWIENRMRGRYDWLYQNWAAGVAKSYGTVRIEKVSFREMADAKANQGDHALRAAAERRTLAACGRLLRLVRNAVIKAGGVIEEVPAAHTTDTCAICGAAFEAGAAIIGRCSNGHERDQDWQASENIYANRGGFQARGAPA
ncbi:MAG TPA: hypothetical protein VFB04_13735 [Terriglobales bacterium]|nr:hypothetical protein [Terriglobales bacterium]